MTKRRVTGIGKGPQDVRSPQNIGAVLGILCKMPLRKRCKIAWLIVRGPSKKMLKNASANKT